MNDYSDFQASKRLENDPLLADEFQYVNNRSADPIQQLGGKIGSNLVFPNQTAFNQQGHKEPNLLEKYLGFLLPSYWKVMIT